MPEAVHSMFRGLSRHMSGFTPDFRTALAILVHRSELDEVKAWLASEHFKAASGVFERTFNLVLPALTLSTTAEQASITAHYVDLNGVERVCSIEAVSPLDVWPDYLVRPAAGTEPFNL